MITVVEYLVIAAVIGAVVFGIAAFVFGRGEQMAPLPARTSPSELPAADIRGDHVRQVRFGLALRGYRMSDVDWTLERLADEIDLLQSRLAAVSGGSPEPQPATPGETAAADSIPEHAGASAHAAGAADVTASGDTGSSPQW